MRSSLVGLSLLVAALGAMMLRTGGDDGDDGDGMERTEAVEEDDASPPMMRVVEVDGSTSTVTVPVLEVRIGEGPSSPGSPTDGSSGDGAGGASAAAASPAADGATAGVGEASTGSAASESTGGGTESSTPTTVTSTPPVPADPGGSSPIGVPGRWELVFADEFEGTSIHTGRWEPAWFASSGYSPPVNVDEVGCYSPSQVGVSGGALELTAQATSSPDCRRQDGSSAGYVSGLVNTRRSFTFTEGYVEARMFLPGDGGALHNWPAVWTNGANWPATGEIDIMEGLTTNRACYSYHWGASGHRWRTTCVEGGDPTGWHTFGVDRRPDRLDYYYDGALVGSYTEGLTTDPHYLVVNYGLTEQNGVDVPSTVRVDYVRVWTRS